MKKNTKNASLLEVLTTVSQKCCPVLPTQKLEEHTVGKMVGMAIGVALVLAELREKEFITDEQFDILNCVLSNRSLDDLKQERAEQEDMNERMREFEALEPETETIGE